MSLPRFLATAFACFYLSQASAQDGVTKISTSEPVNRVYACFENRCKIEVNKLYGFCDSTGKIVIKPVYKEASRFENGYCLVKYDGNSFYINQNGEPLKNDKYGYLDPISPKLSAYTDAATGLKGIIDAAGKELAKPQWKSVDVLNNKENVIRVQSSSNLYGFLNNKLEQIIPCEYDLVYKFENGIITVSKLVNGKYLHGLINKNNKILVPVEFNNICLLKNIYLLETRDKPYKVYDINTGNITETSINYYSSLNIFNPNYKILPSGNGKYALYNSELKKLFEMDNNNCRLASYELGIVAFKKNDLWGLLDTNGKVIHEPEFDEISFYTNGLLAVKKNKLYGYVDTYGSFVIPCQFSDADDFYTSVTSVVYNGESMLVKKGSVGEMQDIAFIKPKQPVDKIYSCTDNRLSVKVGDKFGFIDTSGKLVIKAEFDYVDDFKNGYARVTKGNLKYYINTKGEPLIKPKYGYLTPQGEKYFSYMDTVKKMEGLLDGGGKEISAAKWKFISWMEGSNGLFKARDAVTGKSGIVNAKMETIIPFEYDGFGKFDRALIIAEKDEGNKTRWGVIDEKNNIIVPFEYDRIYAMEDSYLLETTGKPYKGLDLSNGKIWETNIPWYMSMNIKSRNYKIAQDASRQLNLYNSRLGVQYKITESDARIADDENGLIAVKKNGLWGLRNAQGKLIVEPQYDDISSFTNGLAVVEKSGFYGAIDINGVRKIPLQFEYIASMQSKYTGVKYKGETKIIRYSGSTSTPVVITQADKVKATVEAASSALKNIKSSLIEFDEINKAIGKALDGSAKGPNNTVTSLAITYNQQIKNSFLRAMKYLTIAKDSLDIFNKDLFRGKCDNVYKIGDAKEKLNSVLVNILFEKDYLKTYIGLIDIEYTNRTTYQLWNDNVKKLRDRYAERMSKYVLDLEKPVLEFQDELNSCIKVVSSKGKN